MDRLAKDAMLPLPATTPRWLPRPEAKSLAGAYLRPAVRPDEEAEAAADRPGRNLNRAREYGAGHEGAREQPGEHINRYEDAVPGVVGSIKKQR